MWNVLAPMRNQAITWLTTNYYKDKISPKNNAKPVDHRPTPNRESFFYVGEDEDIEDVIVEQVSENGLSEVDD
jgi:hypothetical protein